MKVSLNTLKQYTDITISVEELVAKINEQLGSVEEVIDLGKRYEGAVIAKVVSCRKHENADKLSVCEINAGTGENVQVVCGAPNVREGIFVVWLEPGATVPSSFSEKEPFVLETRELRGVMSSGMLASAKELGIGDSHDGILEIDPNEWKPNDTEIKPGVSFAEAYGLDDYIIDIENKMFTHRPDLFGQLGVAREVFAILHEAPDTDKPTDIRFDEPEWYWNIPQFESASGLELQIFNDAPENVPRLMAVAMKDIALMPSPLWMQITLMRWGSKAINNVVDATNYMMLLTGQPTHAYDYDKLRSHTLGARMAKQGETITLLNGKTYEMTPDDIVIADGEGAIGLGGIMGGSNSEVSAETKNVVLEVANFDMYTVRKSSMRHGIFTDALTRFNKGQSKLQTDRVLSQLMSMLSGVQASEVFDVPELPADFDRSTNCFELRVETDFINTRLGLSLTTQQIGNLLRLVNFASYPADDNANALLITAPFWRTDIELPEDIVEEVGRLYGFEKLPRELPRRTIAAPTPNQVLATKQLIRSSLSGAGANEVLTYSFVHERLLERVSQDKSHAFKLSNALSPDLQYYRLSVLPSLLDKVYGNIRNGFEEFALYEIGKGHATDTLGAHGLPGETSLLEMVYASKGAREDAAYYQAQRFAAQLCIDLNVTVSFEPIEVPLTYPGAAAYEQTRSSLVKTGDGTVLGMVGELKYSVRKAFKLPAYTAAFTLAFDALHEARLHAKPAYRSLSRYPSVSQDLTVRLPTEASYGKIEAVVQQSILELKDLHITSMPISIYQAKDSTQKTISFRFSVTSEAETLTDNEVNEIIETIRQRVEHMA